MTSKDKYNIDLSEFEPEDLLQIDDKDLKAEIMQLGLQQLMEHERGANGKDDRREQTDQRPAYHNGDKPHNLSKQIDNPKLQSSETSNGEFESTIMDHYQRSEKALVIALAQAYAQGVSTRKMKKATENLLGKHFSASMVDRFTNELDTELDAWRKRQLDRAYPYVLLDAHSKKCRQNGMIVDMTVLVAFGVCEEGYRHVLAVEGGLGEPEQVWNNFIGGLKQRGLSGVELFTSDSHLGMQSALQKYYPNASWQRCQYHFLQNALENVPAEREGQLQESLEQIWRRENTPEQAQAKLEELIEDIGVSLPQTADWLSEQAPSTLTVFSVAPESHRRRLRTTFNIERLYKELKQRSKLVRIFPNPESCLRLFAALLKETHEDWISSGWRYMKMEPRKEFQMNRNT